MRLNLIISCAFLPFLSYGQWQFLDRTGTMSFKITNAGDAIGSGIAIGDVDNDGDPDLYVAAERGFPDRIYLNNDGNYEVLPGFSFEGRTRAALWLDFDADHDLDLLITSDCYLDDEPCPDLPLFTLFRNDNLNFTDVTASSGLAGYRLSSEEVSVGGLAAGDLNRDGWLDVVATIWGDPLLILMNNREGAFVNSDSILNINREAKYYQPLIYDLNGDGRDDIFLNVDFGENLFYIQQSDGIFEERARVTNANADFNEMGVALGDYDRDGDYDLYMTNIYRFLGDDVHNILLEQNQNVSGLFFIEKAKSLGVENGGWGWGTTFFDADNDGWLDIAATNGWDVPFEVIDSSKIWLRRGNTFTDFSDSLGFNDDYNATSLMAADFDRDGDLDLFHGLRIFDESKPVIRILENPLPRNDSSHFVIIRPRMEGRNHFAIGASVIAWVGDVPLMRPVTAGMSFLGQEPAEVHIGLGSYQTIDSLEIRWPGGAVTKQYDVAADQIITVMDEEALHRPGDLRAMVDARGLVLEWADNSNSEEGFLLERSFDPQFEQVQQIFLGPNTIQYIDDDFEKRLIYHYRVAAFDGDQRSAFSNYLVQSTFFTDLANENIQVYPNPADDKLHIMLDQPAAVSAFDLEGRCWFTAYYSAQNAEIDIRSWPPGVYVFEFVRSSGRETYRVSVF